MQGNECSDASDAPVYRTGATPLILALAPAQSQSPGLSPTMHVVYGSPAMECACCMMRRRGLWRSAAPACRASRRWPGMSSPPLPDSYVSY